MRVEAWYVEPGRAVDGRLFYVYVHLDHPDEISTVLPALEEQNFSFRDLGDKVEVRLKEPHQGLATARVERAIRLYEQRRRTAFLAEKRAAPTMRVAPPEPTTDLSTDGWLSPQGELYPNEGLTHSKAARTYFGSSYEKMLGAGWIRVSMEGGIEVLNPQAITQPQWELIEEMLVQRSEILMDLGRQTVLIESSDFMESGENLKDYLSARWRSKPQVRTAFLKSANDPVKKKLKVHDMPISLEWLDGETRKYSSGFEKEMDGCSYGYIPETTGADDEELDVYVGADLESDVVVKIEQLTKDGEFDEVKYAICFEDPDLATEVARNHMPPDCCGGTQVLSWEEFMTEVEESKMSDSMEKAAGPRHPILEGLNRVDANIARAMDELADLKEKVSDANQEMVVDELTGALEQVYTKLASDYAKLAADFGVQASSTAATLIEEFHVATKLTANSVIQALKHSTAAQLSGFYIVTAPTEHSVLDDVVFYTDLRGLANQFRGGLAADEVVAIFDEKDKQGAQQLGQQLLDERAAHQGKPHLPFASLAVSAGLSTQVRNLKKRLKQMDTTKCEPAELRDLAQALDAMEIRLEKEMEKKKKQKEEKDQATAEAAQTVTAGTWSVPNTVRKVQELEEILSSGRPVSELPAALYDICGDDGLFDDLEWLIKESPTSTAGVPIVYNYLSRLLADYDRFPSDFYDGFEPGAIEMLQQLVAKSQGEATAKYTKAQWVEKAGHMFANARLYSTSTADLTIVGGTDKAGRLICRVASKEGSRTFDLINDLDMVHANDGELLVNAANEETTWPAIADQCVEAFYAQGVEAATPAAPEAASPQDVLSNLF